MSTYTDIHNRRKENLTILRLPGSENDGMTPQRVIFANPENIYEGTFIGRIDATSVDLSNTNLTNCRIIGGTIEDATIKSGNDKLTITELTTNISLISTQAFETLPELIDDVSSNFKLYCDNINNDLSSLSSKVGISVENLETEISEICSDLSTAISSNNDKISCLQARVNEISGFSAGGLQFIGNATVQFDRHLSTIEFDQRTGTPKKYVDVSAGYMYQIKFYDKSIISENIDGIVLDADDIIIMKNSKNTWYLVSSDICKFDAMDKDVVKKNELCEVSSQLSIYSSDASAYALEQAKYYADSISTSLSTDYVSKINTLEANAATSVDTALTNAKSYTDEVSTSLSTDYVEKINDLETKAATSVDTALTNAKSYTDEVSTSLSTDYVGKIDTTSTNLSSYARETSSASFEASKSYVNGISTSLSIDYVSKINTLEANAATSAHNALTSANAYTNEVSTSLSTDYVEKIETLSSDLCSILSVNVEKGVNYFGSFEKYNNDSLTAFLHNNIAVMFGSTNPDIYKFKTGDQFRFNDKKTLTSDSESQHFGINDYILFNKPVQLSNVKFSDIDVIRDSEQEGIQVSGEIIYLSGQISSLSSNISNEVSTLRNDLCATSSLICLSVDGISGIVNSLNTGLSISISTLTNNLCSISSNICLSVNGISGIVDSLSSGLSTSISTLNSSLSVISSNICLSIDGISGIVDKFSSNISSEVSTLRNDLCSTSSLISLSVYGISGIVDKFSSNISSEVSTLRNDLCSTSSLICLSVDGISNEINKLNANYTLYSDSGSIYSRISVITKLEQTKGKINVEARNLSVSDIENFNDSINQISNNTLAEARNQLCVVITDGDISSVIQTYTTAPKYISLKIKDNAIQTSHLSDNVVTHDKIANNAIALNNLSTDVRNEISNVCDSKIAQITSNIWLTKEDHANEPISAIYKLIQKDGKIELSSRSISALDIIDFNDKVDSKVLPISADISSSLKYVGHLEVKSSNDGQYLSTILSSASYLWCGKTTFKNGYMINVTAPTLSGNLSSNSISTADGFKLGNRDFIIFHDHGRYEFPLSDVGSSNVTIIDSQDDNIVYKWQINDLCSTVSANINYLSNQISSLSSNISNEVSTLRDDLCATSCDLSTQIQQKIFIDNISSDGTHMSGWSDLSIVKVPRTDWETSVAICSDAELSNILFILSSDYIDAYGQPILNIRFPSEKSAQASAAVPYHMLSTLSADVQNAGYFKLSSSNEALCANTFNEVQSFRNGISSDSISTNFEKVFDLKEYRLSTVVQISDTFDSMYNSIVNIKAECQLDDVDFELSYPIVSAFNAINNIAKSPKISVDGIYLDLDSSSVSDGITALSNIVDRTDYRIHRNLDNELKKIDGRFDIDEKSIANMNVQLSTLSAKFNDLSAKYDSLKQSSSEQINYLSSMISSITNVFAVDTFTSGDYFVKLSYLSVGDRLSTSQVSK